MILEDRQLSLKNCKVSIMPGLDRILRGILKYRNEIRPGMVKQFEKIRDNPEVMMTSKTVWHFVCGR